MSKKAHIPDDALYAELEWSVRAHNTIVGTYGDDVRVGRVRRTEDNELKRIPNLGKVTLREIREVLGPYIDTPQMTPTWITFVRQGLQCPRCNEVVTPKLFIPTICPVCGYPNQREEK